MENNIEHDISHEVEVEPRSIAIATTTFYPKWYPGEVGNRYIVDKVRGDLALRLLKEGKEKGHQMVVIDNDSSTAFKEEAEKTGVLFQLGIERGMSTGRRQAFQEASVNEAVKVICWTEPEKVFFIRDCLPAVILPILRGEADIVVPKRTEESYQTYPDYQVVVEKRSNREWNKILRSKGLLVDDQPDLDVWFGPKAFRNDPQILDLFLKKYQFRKRESELDKIIDPELWPNAIFLPIVAALHQGFRVKSVTVPYVHPKEQTEIEVNNPEFTRKRDIQKKNIIVSTIHFIRMLESNPKKVSRLEKQ